MFRAIVHRDGGLIFVDATSPERPGTVAIGTGGEAFVAGDPAALQTVFEKIDAMQPAKFKPETPIPADNFRPFALAGLSMLALQLLTLFGIRFTPW